MYNKRILFNFKYLIAVSYHQIFQFFTQWQWEAVRGSQSCHHAALPGLGSRGDAHAHDGVGADDRDGTAEEAVEIL